MNKKYFFLVLVLILVAVGGAGYYFWPRQADPGMLLIQNYERAMRADIYGGKTPEETLKMFVEALKKEDVELASKYFLLDDNGSREKWVVFLDDLKQRQVMIKLSEDINSKAEPENGLYEGDYKFLLRNKDKTVGLQIDMELNKYSGVWKIESL